MFSTLTMYLFALAACSENVANQPPFIVLTVIAPDFLLATPQPVLSEPVLLATPELVPPSQLPVTGGGGCDTCYDATVNTARLNLRFGPGIGYPILKSYELGTNIVVIGKDFSEQWLYVRTPDGEVGWMATRYLQLSIDPANLEVTEAPPTPTPTKN